jgi:hypothetical protein
VLAYLARYTHRVAISNSRLVTLDERGVTFRYKDYRRPFGVLNGKRESKKLALVFSSGAMLYSGTLADPKVLQESVTGELAKGELRLLYQREGHAGIPVIARRMPGKPGASSIAAPVQRMAIAASRQCFTLRQTRRTVPFMFSMMLVQAEAAGAESGVSSSPIRSRNVPI